MSRRPALNLLFPFYHYTFCFHYTVTIMLLHSRRPAYELKYQEQSHRRKAFSLPLPTPLPWRERHYSMVQVWLHLHGPIKVLLSSAFFSLRTGSRLSLGRDSRG